MGMFDSIICLAPLPMAGANDLSFQTKDTPEQFMDQYEIRADGSLWHQDYELADESELAKWKNANHGQTPPAGLDGFIGCLTQVNKRWTHLDRYDGTINFYTTLGQHHTGWLQFKATYVDGQLATEIELVEHTPVVPDRDAKRGEEKKAAMDKIFKGGE